MVKGAHSAIDAGVTVFGTTVAPNFKRQEGRGKLIVDILQCLGLDKQIRFQPESHVPLAIPIHVNGERNAQVKCSNRTTFSLVHPLYIQWRSDIRALMA